MEKTLVMFGNTLKNIFFLIGTIKWGFNQVFGNTVVSGYLGCWRYSALKDIWKNSSNIQYTFLCSYTASL